MSLFASIFPSDATFQAPSNPNQISTLPSATNILHVSVQNFRGETPVQLLVASTADRKLSLLNIDETFSIYKSLPDLPDSPIFSCVAFGEQGLKTITAGMPGQDVLYDREMDRVLEEKRDHSQYVVKVATWNEIVVNAGWDNKLFLYQGSGHFSSSGTPVAAFTAG